MGMNEEYEGARLNHFSIVSGRTKKSLSLVLKVFSRITWLLFTTHKYLLFNVLQNFHCPNRFLNWRCVVNICH